MVSLSRLKVALLVGTGRTSAVHTESPRWAGGFRYRQSKQFSGEACSDSSEDNWFWFKIISSKAHEEGQNYDIDVYSVWKWPFFESSNQPKDRTGHHVGSAMEPAALPPAESQGDARWQKVPLGVFQRHDSPVGVPFCAAPARTSSVRWNHLRFTSAYLSVIVFSVFYKGNR